MLSLGRVFQLYTLCWLQASFRDIGQNSALRRPVDSATCGPELKQSLGLKSACKKPPNGFKRAPSPAASQACDSQTSTRRLLWQLAALLSASQPLTGHFYRFRTHSPLLSLPNCSQPTPIVSESLAGPQIASEPLAGPQISEGQKNRFRAAHSPLLSLPSCSQATPIASKPLVGPPGGSQASQLLTDFPSSVKASIRGIPRNEACGQHRTETGRTSSPESKIVSVCTQAERTTKMTSSRPAKNKKINQMCARLCIVAQKTLSYHMHVSLKIRPAVAFCKCLH